MVRKPIVSCLVTLCCLGSLIATSWADGGVAEQVSDRVSILKKAHVKRLARDDGKSKLQPAVHVNATGIDSRSDAREGIGAAGRLRSVRDSVILPRPVTKVPAKTPPQQAVKPSPESKPRVLNPGAAVTGSKSSQDGVGLPQVSPAKPPQASAPAKVSADSTTSKPGSAVVGKAPQASLPVVTDPSLADLGPSPLVVDDKGTDSSISSRRTKPQAPSTESREVDSAPTTSVPPQSPQEKMVMPSVVARRGTSVSPPVATGDAARESRFEQRPPSAGGPSEPALAQGPTLPPADAGKPAPLELLDLTPQTAANLLRETPGVKVSPPSVAQRSQPSTGKSMDRMKLDSSEAFGHLQVESGTPQGVASVPQPGRVAPTAPPADDLGGDVLLANRSPVLVVRTHGQSTIRVGRAATYYITAENAGDLSAEDVVVTVNIPSWAEIARNHTTAGLVRVEPSANGDNVMKWSLRDLQPQARQKLRIDMIPRESRPIDLGVNWNFKSAAALAQIEVQEAKLKTSVVGPADMQYGETKLYTISIANPGTGDAENVVLTLLPISDGAGPAGVRELGNLKAGTRRTVEVELTARQAGDLTVRAKATADGGLSSSGEQKVRVRRAELVVEAVGPKKRYAGTAARYAFKVVNKGDATAREVVAMVALPLAAKYNKSSGGGVFDAERGKVRWNIGALRPGAFQVVELTTTLMTAGVNRVEVRSAGADHLSALGAVETQVEALADLKLYVDDPAGVVPVGTEVIYGVRIVNRGTRAAHNVDIVGYFSEGIEPVSVQGWKGDIEVGQVSLDTIPRIAPGQEIVIKVIAEASKPGDHVFRAEVHARDPATKLAVDEWTRFDRGDDVQGLDQGVEQAASKDSTELLR